MSWCPIHRLCTENYANTISINAHPLIGMCKLHFLVIKKCTMFVVTWIIAYLEYTTIITRIFVRIVIPWGLQEESGKRLISLWWTQRRSQEWRLVVNYAISWYRVESSKPLIFIHSNYLYILFPSCYWVRIIKLNIDWIVDWISALCTIRSIWINSNPISGWYFKDWRLCSLNKTESQTTILRVK